MDNQPLDTILDSG